MQKRLLGSIFIPEKYMFRVCFKSPFTRMISSLKYKVPSAGVCRWQNQNCVSQDSTSILTSFGIYSLLFAGDVDSWSRLVRRMTRGGGALTLERGMGMCRGHDPLFSGQSPLPSPIYRQCATFVPPFLNF